MDNVQLGYDTNQHEKELGLEVEMWVICRLTPVERQYLLVCSRAGGGDELDMTMEH